MPENKTPVHQDNQLCTCGDDHTWLTEAEIRALKAAGQYTGK